MRKLIRQIMYSAVTGTLFLSSGLGIIRYVSLVLFEGKESLALTTFSLLAAIVLILVYTVISIEDSMSCKEKTEDEQSNDTI